MKTQNKKWGQERKYDVKTEKCVKKFTVCVFIVQSIFLVGPLKWQRLPIWVWRLQGFPPKFLSEAVKFISWPVVLFQNR